MKMYKKSTIGIISNHSLQHPSGYYFLCDSMCAGGLSGWNVELASWGDFMYAMAFAPWHSALKWTLAPSGFVSFIVTHGLSLFVMKYVSLFVICGRASLFHWMPHLCGLHSWCLCLIYDAIKTNKMKNSLRNLIFMIIFHTEITFHNCFLFNLKLVNICFTKLDYKHW